MASSMGMTNLLLEMRDLAAAHRVAQNHIGPARLRGDEPPVHRSHGFLELPPHRALISAASGAVSFQTALQAKHGWTMDEYPQIEEAAKPGAPQQPQSVH